MTEIFSYVDCEDGGHVAVMQGKERVGYMLAQPLSGTKLRITDVHVGNSCRRQGIATAMYTEICKVASKCGFSHVNGAIMTRAALKARIRVFGEPESLTVDDGSSDWFKTNKISVEQALKYLPECEMHSKNVEVVHRVPTKCGVP